MNVPSYEALLDKETRIKVIRELCENVNKALNSQMSVAEATGTSVEAEVGKYYRYADPVTSLVVTLPQVSGTSQPSNISFFLTTGSDPDIKFESDADVYLSGESTFSDDTSYYITATYDGAEWVVNVSIATFQPHDYSKDYLIFVALESGTFTFTPQNDNVISYSTDNGTTWTEGNNVAVNNGDKVLWKGTMTPQNYYGIGTFGSTGNFDVQGNVMSLLFGDNYKGQTDLTGKDSAFYQLFNNNTKVISAENLSLPATTLAYGCYQNMFYGCTSLTTAPALPATTLADFCYDDMFRDCTSLVNAPQLSATTLAYGCYQNMFEGCTSLKTAPALPATTLAGYCYSNMFNGCTNLTTAPALPATTLAYGCYSGMFVGCTSLTTAPVLPSTTLAQSCYTAMFLNCRSLTTAPELPAITLVSGCYQNMFNGCSNLNYIKAMFTTTPKYTYTSDWVSGVSATGTFVKNSAATWTTTGVNGIPTGWTVQTASA